MTATRINSVLKTTTVSGTTSAAGSLILTQKKSEMIIVQAVMNSDEWAYAIPWAHPYYDEWRIKIISTEANNPSVSNKQVSVRIYYVPAT